MAAVHRARARLVGAAVAAVLVAGTAGCSAEPSPQGTADALAEALATGDFADVPLSGVDAAAAAERRTAAYQGLDPWTVEVTAGDVVEGEEDQASVPLSFTWSTGAAEDWTYTTTAGLVQEDGQWAARWTSLLLAPDLNDTESLEVRRTTAERADVLGAGGAVLVEARQVYRVGVDKTRVGAAEWDGAARSLAAWAGLAPETFAGQVAAAGEKAFVEAIVVRADDPSYVLADATSIPGVNALETTLPLALTRTFARPVLGTVGQATAEVVEESDGAITAGDLTGLGGLQRQFDEQLRGTPGVTVVATAGDARSRELFHVEPQVGEPLRTTLDPTLQMAAENLLSPVAGASAIVAIRPSTGEVLVAAAGPDGDGTSTSTLGLYAPGSTFKVVSALAMLRSGMTPDSVVDCPTTITVDGREFQNVPGYPTDRLGQITLRGALASSCNTAFIGSRDVADQQSLATAGQALGLVEDADLGFAAALGTVPTEAEGTDHAASMIGQGRIQVTPLGMATVAASVVAGARVTPTLLAAREAGGPAADPQPLTTDEAQALRDMMRAMVTEGGGTFLQDVPGAEVIAKSGTAQYGADDALANHTWMIAGQDDLAVAVLVATGDSGTGTAGPLLEGFLQAANS